MRALAALLVALLCRPLAAAQIEALKVDHTQGHYRVSLRVMLDVSAPRAYAVFVDPINLHLINPAIQEVQLLPDDQLYTRVRVCAGIFCKTLRQLQQMRYAPRADGGHIWAQVIPKESDLSSGSAQWEFHAAGERTQLQFDADLVPAFWIPPLLGPWIVENSMREEAQRTSSGIENLARSNQ